MKELSQTKNLYSTKPTTYFGHIRHDAISLLPKSIKRIVELGCASGLTLLEIKKKTNIEYCVGLDINPAAISQGSSAIDKLAVFDIEASNIPDYIHNMDAVLCLDVLEHLNSPLDALLKFKARLSENGCIVISLPNIQHYSVSFPLVFKGQWKMTDEGILDRTHLRFFTKSTILDLATEAKMAIQKIEPQIHRRRDQIINKLTFRLFEGLLSKQYVLRLVST